MKKKISSLTVLKEVLYILPDDIVYLISKYHGRWVKLNVPTSIKIKVKEPRNKRCRKKHLITTYHI